MKLTFHEAEIQDVQYLVKMLADDPLGAQRERFRTPLPQSYLDAFEAINRDDNNELVVAANMDDQIVGFLQLTFIPYLTYQGGWRALIEGVRVTPGYRSKGVGRKLFQWAINRARERDCHLLQLTTDKARPDALRFYERLGFKASHEGMKLHLNESASQSSLPD